MKFDHLQGGKLGDKISLSDYFYVQFKTLAYLFRTAPSKTLILTTSLVIRSFYEFVSLKYLKYLTNAAAMLFTGESDSPNIVIRNALLFIVCISLFVINEAFINRFQIHYTENIYFAVKKQINSKLINVQYEYFESSFYAGQLARIKSINQRARFGESFIFLRLSECWSYIQYCFMISVSSFRCHLSCVPSFHCLSLSKFPHTKIKYIKKKLNLPLAEEAIFSTFSETYKITKLSKTADYTSFL